MKSSLLKQPFFLGKTELPSNIFYAPLAGCSNFPFRQMSACFKPGLMYCEMVKMEALIRRDEGTLNFLDYEESMRPIGAQVVGSNPLIAGESAKMIEDLGFDVLDFNCGCPVDKVTKDGSGSGMLKDPQRIGDILAAMVAAVNIPVTVKIRAGWDEKQINAPEITRIAEEAGAQAIAVHGRTRQQGYSGPANWDFIKACKEEAKTIKVIGNGDVMDADAALQMFAYTGCDAVLVARGTMGQPWIVEDIICRLEGKEQLLRDGEFSRQQLLRHFRFSAAYHNERRAIFDMRKAGCWYIKKTAGTRDFRHQISRAESLQQVEELIQGFSFSKEAAGG